MTAGQVALLLLGATILLVMQTALSYAGSCLWRRLSELEEFVLSRHDEEINRLKDQLVALRHGGRPGPVPGSWVADAPGPDRRLAYCVAKPGLPCAWSGWIPSPKTGVQFRTCGACGTGQVEPLPGGPQGRQVEPFQPPPAPATLAP